MKFVSPPRHLDTVRQLIEPLGPRASAGTPEEAAMFGEAVLLTIPLKAIPDIARDLAPLLSGKLVLDTSNAYERRDGDDSSTGLRASTGVRRLGGGDVPRQRLGESLQHRLLQDTGNRGASQRRAGRHSACQ